jgi:hypothetical protein
MELEIKHMWSKDASWVKGTLEFSQVFLPIFLEFKSISKQGSSMVAHVYNPSYSGGRDGEDHSSLPTQQN